MVVDGPVVVVLVDVVVVEVVVVVVVVVLVVVVEVVVVAGPLQEATIEKNIVFGLQ